MLILWGVPFFFLGGEGGAVRWPARFEDLEELPPIHINHNQGRVYTMKDLRWWRWCIHPKMTWEYMRFFLKFHRRLVNMTYRWIRFEILLREDEKGPHGGIIGQIYLSGGFKYCLFSPYLGEDSHFDLYFSNELVQPPTRIYFHPFKFWKIFKWRGASFNLKGVSSRKIPGFPCCPGYTHMGSRRDPQRAHPGNTLIKSSLLPNAFLGCCRFFLSQVGAWKQKLKNQWHWLTL